MPRKRVHTIRETAANYAAANEVVSATEFKARCLELIDRIQQTNGEVIVTRYGKPVARLTPIAEEKRSAWGWMRGSVARQTDIIASTGEVWDAEADK